MSDTGFQDSIRALLEGAPSRDEEGRAAWVDQAHRQFVKLLQETSDLEGAILAAAPVGVAVVSGPELIFQRVNDAYRGIIPDPAVDLLGRAYDDVWPAEDGNTGKSLFLSVLEEDASVVYEKIQKIYPDGSRRTFTLHACPFTWNEQPAVLLTEWETTEYESEMEQAKSAQLILDALMDFIPEGISIILLPDFQIAYNSRYGAGLAGYSREGMEGQKLKGETKIWDLFHADGVTQLSPDEWPFSRGAQGEIIDGEEVVLKLSGQDIHLLINAGPIRDGKGQTTGAVVAYRDITERKRAESFARFMSDLGKSLVSLRSPEEIMKEVAHRVGRYMFVDRCMISSERRSGSGQTIYGEFQRHPLDTAGLPIDRWIAPRVFDRLKRGKAAIVADAAVDPLTSAWFAGADISQRIRSFLALPVTNREGHWFGSIIIANTAARTWRPDEVNLLIGVGDLISLALDNAFLFQELDEFRYRFEVALHNAPMSVFSVDSDLRINWIFQSLPKFTGEEALGRFVEDLLPQDAAEQVGALLRYVLLSGASVRQEVAVKRDGVNSFFDLSVEALRGTKGNTEGVMVAAMDVSEQRRMEAEVEHNLAQIEVQRQLIRERESERTRIAREIHDGPLQDLIATNFTLVEAMEINEKEQRVSKMREIQHSLRLQIQELRRFCNDLRPPVLGPFGLEKTIRSHAETFHERFPNIKLRLELEKDAKLLPEELRMTLFRVYQELLTNVARHASATQLVVRFWMEVDQVFLEVEDNGIGFESPDNWVELARNGHLGLVGLQERVEMAGGQVEIWSHSGQGTRIRVVIPR